MSSIKIGKHGNKNIIVSKFVLLATLLSFAYHTVVKSYINEKWLILA